MKRNIPPTIVSPDYEPPQQLCRADLRDMRDQIIESMLRVVQGFYIFAREPLYAPPLLKEQFTELGKHEGSFYGQEGDYLDFDDMKDTLNRMNEKTLTSYVEASRKILKEQVRLYQDINGNLTLSLPTRCFPIHGLPEGETVSHAEFHDVLLALFDLTRHENAKANCMGNALHAGHKSVANPPSRTHENSSWYSFADVEKLSGFVNCLLSTGIRYEPSGKTRYVN